MKKFAKEYTYESFDSYKKICHLVVLAKFNIAVATELNSPISNDLECLVEKVCKDFSLVKDKLVFIAHYAKTPYSIRHHEEAQLITFNHSSNDGYSRNSVYLSKNELEAIKNLVKIEANCEIPS